MIDLHLIIQLKNKVGIQVIIQQPTLFFRSPPRVHYHQAQYSQADKVRHKNPSFYFVMMRFLKTFSFLYILEAPPIWNRNIYYNAFPPCHKSDKITD